MLARKVAARRRRRRNSRDSAENDELVESYEEPYEGEGCGDGGHPKEVEEVEDASPKPKPWLVANREVYETQLEKLQEHLVSTMLENQALQAELEERNKLPEADLRKELEKVCRENQQLSRRLDRLTRGQSDTMAVLDRMSEEGSYGGSTLTLSTEEDYEKVSMCPDRVTQLQQERIKKKRTIDVVWEWVLNFLSDFTEDVRSSTDEDSEEATPLTVKGLKENISRIKKSSKPWRESASFVQDVLHWKNPAESLVAFLIYMYCVWHGWLVQLLLFIAIIKLTLNYLYTSGLAEHFGFGAMVQNLEDSSESLGLTDKIHLVKQVAQKVQNISGQLSDTLEKAYNLCMWRQPEATRKLYSFLWAFFIVSLFLPNNWILTLIGLGLGMKMFIIENIFRKYPKVKQRHDTVAQLWDSLPTDAELFQRQSMSAEEMLLCPRRLGSDSTDNGTLSEEETSFYTRFQLSPEEIPLPAWRTGKKCSTLDKDRPLLSARAGKLFLTHSYLCFEKSSVDKPDKPDKSDKSGKARDSDRLLISLTDIVSISKAKPFAVLPGSGMAIEIAVKDTEKPVMFGAILQRDQVIQSILDQAMILGLPWGTDPDDGNRLRNRLNDSESQNSQNAGGGDT